MFAVTSLVFAGGSYIISDAFYGMQDTKSPQISAVITVICNIIFNLVLIRYMQAAGLALATSIAFFIRFTVLFIQFRRKCGAFGGFNLLKNITKFIVAAASMVPVFYLCELFRNGLPLFVFFAASVAISLCVYALLLYLLKVELFMESLNRVKTILKNRFKKNNP
jgi:putative peptidoglycan lipid II flippase